MSILNPKNYINVSATTCSQQSVTLQIAPQVIGSCVQHSIQPAPGDSTETEPVNDAKCHPPMLSVFAALCYVPAIHNLNPFGVQ